MWGIHLSSSREWMNLGPVIQSEVSKEEKRMSDINAYIYIKSKKMVLMYRLQSSNGDTDVEDRPVEAVGGGEGGTSW